jgi:hypothetical protein
MRHERPPQSREYESIRQRVSLWLALGAFSPKMCNEPIEVTNLLAVYPIARLAQRKPLCSIHFRKLLRSTGFWLAIPSKMCCCESSENNSLQRPRRLRFFPFGCLISPKPINYPAGFIPVSSSNSRRAAVKKSSPASTSRFGTDQAPKSFLRHSGPPG